MPNSPAVAVLGPATPVETPDGTTIHVLPTKTGHILVGPDDSVGEMTVVVSGPTTIDEVTASQVFGAAAKGVKALCSLLDCAGDGGDDSGGWCCEGIVCQKGNHRITVTQTCGSPPPG